MDDEHRTQLEEINAHLSDLVAVLSRLLKLSEMKLWKEPVLNVIE